MKTNNYVSSFGIIGSLIAIVLSNFLKSPKLAIISLTALIIFLIIYCIDKFSSKIGFFLYIVCIFVFLCARPILLFFMRDQGWMCGFSSEEFIPAISALFISLIFLLVGFKSGNRHLRFDSWNINLHSLASDDRFNISKIQKICIVLALISTVIATVFEIERYQYALLNGYISLYYGYSKENIARRLLIVSRSCIFIGLATAPSKNLSKKFLTMLLVIPFLELLEGARSEFAMTIIFIFFYFYSGQDIRDESKNKREHIRYITFAVIAAVIGMPILHTWGYLRIGTSYNNNSITEGILSFLSGQSGSFNLVGYAVRYKDKLPGINYTFGALIDKIRFNHYESFTVEAALNSNSYGTVMTYLTKRWNYLNLHDGIGSSYIGELLYDFGYAGVAIGNFVIGYILSKLTNFKGNSVFSQSIFYVFFYYMFTLPRKNFLNPVLQIISITNILTYIVIFSLSAVRRVKYFRPGEKK